eukprot:scaffold90_cov163-Ochromonas_danica.AAC.25
MESQEAAMTNKVVEAAISMNKMLESKAMEVKEFQLKKHEQFLERIRATRPEDLTALDHMRMTVSKILVQDEENEAMKHMKAINLQIYEDELREIRSKGAACMVGIEGWNFSDAFYWACVTTMTVGYGDVVPTTASGKIFTIIYVLFSTALAAKGFRDVVCYPMIVKMKENEAFLLAQFSEGVKAQMLKKILNNDLFKQVNKLQYNPEQITKAEFILLILFSMNKMQMKDILLASKCFDSLDVHGDGALGQKEQKEQMLLAQQRDRERYEEEQQRRAEEQLRQQQQMSSVVVNGISNILRTGLETVVMVGDKVGGTVGNLVGAHNSPTRDRRGSSSYRNLEDDDGSHDHVEEGLRTATGDVLYRRDRFSISSNSGVSDATVTSALHHAIQEGTFSADPALHKEGAMKHVLASHLPPRSPSRHYPHYQHHLPSAESPTGASHRSTVASQPPLVSSPSPGIVPIPSSLFVPSPIVGYFGDGRVADDSIACTNNTLSSSDVVPPTLVTPPPSRSSSARYTQAPLPSPPPIDPDVTSSSPGEADPFIEPSPSVSIDAIPSASLHSGSTRKRNV